MLTSKQRAFLRSLASNSDTILTVGKGGLSPEVINQADAALTARELIKGKVLETAGASPRDIAENTANATNSEVVQVIGSKFVLFRRNPEKPKIDLPKAKKGRKII